MWDNIQGGFFDHLEQISDDLKAAGLPVLNVNAPSEVEDVEKKEESSEYVFANAEDAVVVKNEEPL